MEPDRPPSPPPLTSWVVGRSHAGPVPRVVLAHGFTQTGRSWDRLAGALSTCRVVACVDLPGHGASSAQRPADLEEAAALLGATGGRASYVGYSLGGRTCLTLALARPELVERLVLVGATAGIADPAERARRRADDAALAAEIEAGGREGLPAFLDRWLAGPLFAHLTDEQADRPARRASTPEGLGASLRACGTGCQEPSWDRLGELAMPVLVVAGERDERYVRLGEALAAGIGGNASLAVVPGAGHAVPFEAPDAFLALLEGFLPPAAPAAPAAAASGGGPGGGAA